MKKEIDAVGAALMGDDKEVPAPVGASAVAVAAEKGFDHVAENRPLIRTIKGALREEGWKVSGNAIARSATRAAHFAVGAHIGFAMYDGYEGYHACMTE